jgi:hypothetical protein
MQEESWTQSQIEFLKWLKEDKSLTWAKMAESINNKFKMHLNKESIRKRWDRLKENGIVRVNASITKVSSNQIGPTLMEYIESTIKKMRFKPIKVPKKLNHYRKQNLEMHLLRSDAQVGEFVDPIITNGLGNYNFNVYVRRIETLVQKVILFHDQDFKSLGLSKLVSPQLGDQVEGEGAVYKGQSYYIDRPLVDQLFGSLEVEISKFWLPLAQIFNEIELYCVPGNHGRGASKGEHHDKTNWDYVYYKSLQTMLAPIAPNIKIYVSEGPGMLVEHGKYLFSYSHGDVVASYMGLPFYGLDRMARRISNMFNKYIHYFCVGHFHNPASLNDNVYVNGTLVGGSNLSINRMNMNSIPSQKLFYLDLEKGINRESNLYLEEAKELQPDKKGIYTPYT